ncbi:restriction endonuclease [Planctomycetales bacterium]|nr:restriction endonuclease [Planctomycetales bacterium]
MANVERRPPSAKQKFTKGFLVVTPGITIKDRLRVLYPNDPDSYYAKRELVPAEMLTDLRKAKIVVTNFHAFKLRDRMDLSKGGRALLQGHGAALNTLETEGQMLQRVLPELMGMKNIFVINDEAHHCYREKTSAETAALKGEEKQEAEQNNEAARVWISGLETVKRKIGVALVLDLSATPFFLRGSGYAEGTLFPWTMSDFSLMDAIECGIVKLPRVPVADNRPDVDLPMYRNLWEHIRAKMPKKGRGSGETLDPLSLPAELQTAIETLYGHYEKTFALWEAAKTAVPPCFIIVCNNTAASKLVYDYVSGFRRENADGRGSFNNGRCALFRNYDDNGEPLPRPRTLLIDSQQLESGEALDKNFLGAAKDEIDRFRQEVWTRTGDRQKADRLTDAEILREVMNTVGKSGQLGGAIRCVVSVSMLTEGWDAKTVTHILGVRAFGTQLLCEQVIGRALRRHSYELNEKNLFNVEYADVFGIPFNFTAKPVVAPVQKPLATVRVYAVSPERDALEIRFPRVAGYRTELPNETLTAQWTAEAKLVLNPNLVGATKTENSGIIGEKLQLDLEHLRGVRDATVLMRLTQRLLETKFRDDNGEPKLHLYGRLKAIVVDWYQNYFSCVGDTFPAQLLYQELADMVCNRIVNAITAANVGAQPVVALLDAYNAIGSTAHVNFTTSKTNRWKTDSRKCHVNWAILDSDWEGEFCRVAESNPRVLAYVKNQGLGFEVPYRYGATDRKYLPDFIVLIDDGHGAADPLHLIVEIKGYRGEDAKEKKSTMDTYWIPSVNHLQKFGRWAFVEFQRVFEINDDFAKMTERSFAEMVAQAAPACQDNRVER